MYDKHHTLFLKFITFFYKYMLFFTNHQKDFLSAQGKRTKKTYLSSSLKLNKFAFTAGSQSFTSWKKLQIFSL